MALILEVLAPGRGHEVRARLPIGDGPLTVGRALDNAVVLDDPHVDAHHARIERGPDGTLVVVDLGSVNQLGTAGGRGTRAVLVPGSTVALGRTLLRLRDSDAPVPPAVPLAAVPAGGGRWFERTAGRVGLVAAALALAGLDTWLEATERGAATATLSNVIFFAVAGLVWAGVWSVAARAVLGQFRFVAHLSVAALGYLGVLALAVLDSWGQFLLPAARFFAPVYAGLHLFLLAAVVAWHLASASHLAALQRWRAGAVASGIVLALMGVFAAIDEDEFTSAAEFSGVVKTVTPALVPQQDAAAFGATIAALRVEVDSLLARE